MNVGATDVTPLAANQRRHGAHATGSAGHEVPPTPRAVAAASNAARTSDDHASPPSRGGRPGRSAAWSQMWSSVGSSAARTSARAPGSASTASAMAATVAHAVESPKTSGTQPVPHGTKIEQQGEPSAATVRGRSSRSTGIQVASEAVVRW